MTTENLDRAEVARGLEKEFEEIKSTAKEFCLPDASLAILRLEDVYDDWRNGEFSRLLYPDERRDQEEIQATAYFRRANYLLYVGEIALSLLLENGHQCGRQIRNFPHIYDIISVLGPKEAVDELWTRGKIRPVDAYFVSSVNILGTIPMTEVIILEGARDTEAEEFMYSVLNWHKRLMVYLSKRRAVRKGKDMRIEETETGRMLVSEGVHTDEELFNIFMKERATPRHLVGTAWHAAHWASDFQDVARENYRDIDSPRDPNLNIDYVIKEEDAIAGAYASFPGFTDLFEKTYRCKYASFTEISRALFRLVMQANQHVYYASIGNMLNILEEGTGLTKNTCRKIIEAMTWKQGEDPLRYPIYSSGIYRYTSYRRLSAARFAMLEPLFTQAYGHEDEKGKAFEERCRELLRKSNFFVYPERLVIPFQIVPTEVSEALWGRKKTRTDFDVLARINQFCLVIECKETKVPFQRVLKSTHLFEKYTTELYYKTMWIHDNSTEFKKVLDQARGSGDLLQGTKYLIPLMVTTFPFDLGSLKIALLTYSELGVIARSFDKVRVEKVEGEEFAILPWRSEETSIRSLALPFG